MTPPLMHCPNCGFSQPPADECVRCGVFVDKARGRPIVAAPPPVPAAAPSQQGVPWLVPLFGFLLATLGLLIFLRPQKPVAHSSAGHEVSAPVSGSSRRATGWREGALGYREADEERQRTGRAMAVYFHTDWCGWCRKMENEILTAGEAAEYLDGIPKVKINPESGDEEAALARKYGVQGFPTFLIVPASGGNGRRVHPFLQDGTMTPAEFVAACREAE